MYQRLPALCPIPIWMLKWSSLSCFLLVLTCKLFDSSILCHGCNQIQNKYDLDYIRNPCFLNDWVNIEKKKSSLSTYWNRFFKEHSIDEILWSFDTIWERNSVLMYKITKARYKLTRISLLERVLFFEVEFLSRVKTNSFSCSVTAYKKFSRRTYSLYSEWRRINSSSYHQFEYVSEPYLRITLTS